VTLIRKKEANPKTVPKTCSQRVALSAAAARSDQLTGALEAALCSSR